MGLPGQEDKSNPIYEAAQVKDIEEALDVYVFSLFRYDDRDYRNYRQRSILVTLKPQSQIENRLEELAEEITELEGIEDSFHTELLTDRDFIDLARKKRPQDSTIVSLESPLVVAKRSPNTGRVFHNANFDYCPETSVPLRYVVASASEQ